MITHNKLLKLLEYNPNTGNFIRKYNLNGKTQISSVAGNLHSTGYINIYVDKKRYKAHRLAWYYVHGVWPKNEIDHVNGIKNDNRLINLREASRQQNNFNRGKPKNNSSGYKGVYWHKQSNKWRVQYTVDSKKFSGGYFTNIKEAAKRYEEITRQLHGEFKNET